MNAHELRARRPVPTARRSREARLTVAVVAGTIIALGGVALVGATRDPGGDSVASSAGPVALAAPAVAPRPPPSVAAGQRRRRDEHRGRPRRRRRRRLRHRVERLALTDTGRDVSCLQLGLINAGYTSVTVSGTFDTATYTAVESLQTERKLFVDGIVGRETAISIGVWPDEQSFVVRTPPPAEGATDSWGMALSSVSSVGADAPPVPADSGSGKRVVYERKGQRVWAIDDDEQVVRSWLVSGSKYGNETPGFHEVYSRSEQSTAWNGQAKLPLMIRYLQTDIGAIGFHGIPIARLRRRRLPDRGRARHPAVRRLPAPGQPRRRLPLAVRPRRHHRRRHLRATARTRRRRPDLVGPGGVGPIRCEWISWSAVWSVHRSWPIVVAGVSPSSSVGASSSSSSSPHAVKAVTASTAHAIAASGFLRMFVPLFHAARCDDATSRLRHTNDTSGVEVTGVTTRDTALRRR